MTEKIEKLIKALEANCMEAFYAETKEEALEIVKGILPKGGTVTHGGSVSLQQCGIIDLLKSGTYQYLDRSAPGITPEQVAEVYAKTATADVYLTSTNAITMDGCLYNVDGNSNRVSAILYGPKQVVFVVGVNKITEDLDEAVERVRAVAAPKNAARLHCPTYCAEKGRCVAPKGAPMGQGCGSEGRICCNYVVSAKQRHKNRMKVILVNQELGY